MKRSLTAVAVALIFCSAGCDTSTAPSSSPETPDRGEKAEANTPATSANVATPGPATGASIPASAPAPGAPDFAALYPGAEVEGEPTIADGVAGPGGLVTFTTDASPDDVIGFYRQRAEAAGLAPVMSMNQGDARAYGAALAATDASVQVVASPAEDGAATSVQLSWSAGQ